MPWKMPQRPEHKISQVYNDGVAQVFSVADQAAPGYQPVEALTLRVTLRYAERRLGLQRYYAAAQNQIRAERVVRVPHTGLVSSQDVLIDEAGIRYRIDLVQLAPDVYPVSEDLTLVRYEQGAETAGGV